jgi:hypothetical protein
MDNSSNQNFEKGTSASSLLHGSKSESNLFLFHKSGVAMDTTSNSGLNAATSMQIVPNNRDLEDMVTSTPASTASTQGNLLKVIVIWLVAARSVRARSVRARSVRARSVRARSVRARSVRARSVRARSVRALDSNFSNTYLYFNFYTFSTFTSNVGHIIGYYLEYFFGNFL